MKLKALLIGFSILIFATQCKSWKSKQVEKDKKAETVLDAPARPDKDYIPVDPAVRIGKLPNGMTYYIRQNKKPEKKVELRLAINAGSILEDKDQLGLAHFMEHMNFNGLKHFPKNELVDFLQKMGVRFGADLNAYTSFDETVYMLPIPLDNPENLDKGLLVIHDWAYFADLDSLEIEKERGVVLEEYRIGLGAEKRMYNKTLPIMLKDSRYAERLPIGKKEILENFPHEALKRFHKDWYRPDLQAIIVVGDIDPDEVEAKIKKLFADIPPAKNPKERKYYTVPNHNETLIAIAEDPEAQFNMVQVIYKDREDYKKEETVEDYKNYLVSKLFTTMLNNRLEDLKDQADPPFSMASSRYGLLWSRTKEAFTLFAITDTDKRLKALETLLKEAKRVKEYGFKKEELERAKKELLSFIEEAYNNRHTTESGRLVWQYVRHYLKGESIPSVEWEYNMYKYFLPQIGLNEVNSLSKKYIHDDNRVIVIHGKQTGNKPSLTEDMVKQVVERIDQLKLENNQEESKQLVLMKEKPAPGKILKTETDDVLKTKTYYLSNGAKVVTKKTDFKEDQVLFMGLKMGGKSLLDTETLKKTGFAFQGIPEAGVNGLKKSDLRKVLSGKKAKVNPAVGENEIMTNGKTLRKDLETALQLNYLYFTNLNKDKAAFESWKKRTVALYGNLANSPQFKFFIALSDFANQNNPRYIGIFPTKEVLEKTDYDLTYRKFRELYDGATDFTYYIVGNFDESEIENLIKTYLASIPPSGYKGEYKDWGDYSLKGEHEFIFHAGKDPKSMVYLIMGGKAKYNPQDKLKLEILGKILTNKLIEKLREEEGGVYGVGARGSMEKVPHEKFSFLINFPCGPENARKLTRMALDELNKLIQEGPTEEDLKKVTKSLLVKFDEDVKTNEFWLDYLSDNDYLKSDPHRIKNYKNLVNTVKPSDIQAVGKKYLSQPETKILAIWYPEGFEDKK